MAVGILQQSAKVAALNAANVSGMVFFDTTLHLFVNNIQVAADTVLGDLVEATFGGYAEEAGIAFGPAYLSPDGDARLTAPGTQFSYDGTGPQETVYGWYLTDSTGATIRSAANITPPVPLANEDDGLIVAPEVNWR